jgi:hypothetical protein
MFSAFLYTLPRVEPWRRVRAVVAEKRRESAREGKEQDVGVQLVICAATCAQLLVVSHWRDVGTDGACKMF